MTRWTVYDSGFEYPNIRAFYALAEGMVHSRGWLAVWVHRQLKRSDP